MNPDIRETLARVLPYGTDVRDRVLREFDRLGEENARLREELEKIADDFAANHLHIPIGERLAQMARAALSPQESSHEL